jgi:methionine-rich copper-binding protein CopC
VTRESSRPRVAHRKARLAACHFRIEEKTMRSHAFVCAALLFGAATAQAHVKVESTKPADKSRGSAPAAIELGFSEEAALTELTLQRGKEPVQKLKIPATPDSVVVAVPLPPLAAGNYVVTYRVESLDGHATTGKFTFTVDPATMHHDMPQGMKHDAGKDGHQ